LVVVALVDTDLGTDCGGRGVTLLKICLSQDGSSPAIAGSDANKHAASVHADALNVCALFAPTWSLISTDANNIEIRIALEQD
jgi:hypothetical protein